MRWRFIETPPERGDFNMALDAALSRGGFCETPTLRIFHWQPFCISLGYHQAAEEIHQPACAAAGIDVARRPTGGGAILHAQEVTYSVSIPAEHAWYKLLPLEVYRRISEALARGLQRLGAAVTFARGEFRAAAISEGRALGAACFTNSARNEILCEGKKLVGSAQRRFREGALQHGSILLGSQHQRLIDFLASGPDLRRAEQRRLMDHTTTLEEACRRKVGAHEVISALLEGFQQAFSIQFESGRALPEELELAAVWRERYRVFMNYQEASLCSDAR
jgi:lipoate-protein ligase A